VKFVVIDFETFYSQDYTLTKLSTEDYVYDPRFEVILVGIKINNDAPYWVTGTKAQIKAHLDSLELQKCAVVAHNMPFDGLILAVHFGIICGMYLDTLALAQAQLKPFNRSISLDSCLKHLDLGIKKGDAVYNMKGRSRASLSRQELLDYAKYCMDDCEGEFRLFRYLAPQVPKAELDIIDMTVRMYLVPTLKLDPAMLPELLAEARAKQLQVMNSLPADVQKPDLMSNPKFAEALERYGATPPTKISPTTGELTFAFAKTDPAWKEFEEEWDDDPIVSALIMGRLSAKSTIEESRLERLMNIANQYPHFRIPLKYYAAHTGRYGGTEGINVQNFPRIDKSRMRYAVLAPPGHVVLAADLAQIEARITAWLAGEKDLLTAFRNGDDIYSEFATTAFGIETVKDRSPDDKKRRFVGKTCILGLGFGMGAPRLKATLRKDNLKFELDHCHKFVSVYRDKFWKIPELWQTLDRNIPLMASGQGIITFGPVTFAKHSIVLPNGMALVYNNCRYHQSQKYTGYVYNFAGETRTLWGGKVCENIVQALARILVMEHMLAIKKLLGLSPALQQHDELDYVIPEKYAEKVAAAVTKIMRRPPSWAPDLPVNVEVNYGPSLGHCK
jgi:DNA polymerase I-like protein with 3'-5' exonuclease and polymerase domains